jgi:hypothetical protein
MMTQTITAMKAFGADAFLVAMSVRWRLSFLSQAQTTQSITLAGVGQTAVCWLPQVSPEPRERRRQDLLREHEP